MRLTPAELERLTIFTAAELARRRRTAGIRLNHPEAVALVCDEVYEAARAGLSYDEVVRSGMSALTTNDVIEGVEHMVSIRLEVPFVDGTRLVVINQPIRAVGQDSTVIPGEVRLATGRIELNEGRERSSLAITNQSDRPIFVGSHFPLSFANRSLHFDRDRAILMHLDIPAGDAVGWEPGETKTVGIVAYGGTQTIRGFNGRTEGKLVGRESLRSPNSPDRRP